MLNKEEITDIFFDLDDTLWDFKKNSELTFEHILNKNRLTVSLREFMAIYRPINEKYWKLYRENQIKKSELRFLRLADAFEGLGIQVENEMILQLADDFILHLSDFNHLIPESVEILNYLFPKYRLHILTNGFSEIQIKKMHNAQVHQYFKTMTASDEFETKKPDPKIFSRAVERAGATIQNSIMIGDNFEADVLGAQNFGMKAIYYNPENKLPTSDYSGIQISSLLQLREIL